jgi:outer membrane immunogenic protein
MKKTIVLAVSAFAVANVAQAADLAVKAPVYKAPVVAPFSWTGLYIGVEGGGAWARESWLDNGVGSADFRANGAFFGGQVGYRYQLGQFVLGIEAAGAPGNLKDTNSAGTLSETFKVQSLYNVTGQVGFALDRWLPYVKGGWGGAQTNLFAQRGAASASQSENNSGWIVGGGLDYAITNNIVLGVAYEHYDLDFADFTAPASNGSTPLIVNNASRLKVDAVLGRFNFKF